MDSLENRINKLDTSIFTVPTQTGEGDRRTLLSLQSIVRRHRPGYAYMELGSYLGGTLLPHLVDPACSHVFSIDKRPASQADERGVIFDYDSNSTDGMIKALKPHISPAAFLKLTTLDLDLAAVNLADIPPKIDFAFIDAEHTNVAVFRDFMNILKFLSPSFFLAFHDAGLILDGILNIETFLQHQGIAFNSFFFADSVYVITSGEIDKLAAEPLSRLSVDREEFINRNRIWRLQEIARNASLINGKMLGHLPA